MAGDWKRTEDAAQAIAFWLDYQRKRFCHCSIREIAVVTEWAVLLHTPAWLSNSGRAIRVEQALDDGTAFQVRRIFRALPLLPKVDEGSGENRI